ncbi:BPSS1780 family membrane protein [Amantichitinum ursilacus]|uniref:DUF7847 domain-containing protein n=1 Tax=Amantichitinum ursilacus TaxID=857265 RepID=A0A0N0GMX2_9NEIS|nr:BPSS1780 family membrane protein [Amantichitinum ursilacus]KPC52139.1 hypothetical protein WG78_13805 [Amantichitinum ursilacus]
MDDSGLIIDTTPEPRRVPLSHSWTWIRDALKLYKRHIGRWMLISVSVMAVLLTLSAIPYLGIISPIIMPLLLGGAVWCAHLQVTQDLPPDFPNLLIGLRKHTRSLLGVGLLYAIGAMLIMMAIMAVVVALLPGHDASALQSMQKAGELPDLGGNGFWIALLFVLGLMLINSIYFFAPPLVIMRDMGTMGAMKTSYLAFWRNWLALLLSGLILVVFIMVASMILTIPTHLLASINPNLSMLPSLVLLLAVMPLTFLLNYTCYADVFSPVTAEG